MRFIRGRENYNILVVRILGVDVGRRRIGLAISDCSQTLARPLATLTLDAADGQHARHAADRVAVEVARLAAEDDGLGAIVVGMPVRLDGSPNDETPHVIAFIAALETRTAIPVVTEGERLTSREAESQLARTERDWRKRKAQLDAEAAAIILQDYLDRPANSGGAVRERY
jgi:putative Holliday junction resolvase